MNSQFIALLAERILAGGAITFVEALELSRMTASDLVLLAAYANQIREHFAGATVDMCGIINARSGHCSEDCKYCAQSGFHQTDSPVYSLLSTEQLIAAARQAEAAGATRASLVTSGKGMENDPDFDQIFTAIKAITQTTSLKVCANLGTITFAQAQQLAAAGVKRYAHNLETSRRFYPEVCTTHSYEERVKTLKAVQAAGMELCAGGIIGLGENWEDRLELAFTLRDFNAASIPINILNPIKGTALENTLPPTPLEVIKTFAIFRFILPNKVLRPAGGREINLRDMQGALMLSGANGLIVGNYLTFNGRKAADDFTMVYDAGLNPV